MVSEACLLVEETNQLVGEECVQVADLGHVELSRVRFVITAALSEREGMASDAINVLQDGFAVEASSLPSACPPTSCVVSLRK